MISLRANDDENLALADQRANDQFSTKQSLPFCLVLVI